jgi:hypothetical protein
MTTISAEYELVTNAAREASAAFRQAQKDYRAMRIGDAEFLVEKAKYDKVQAMFDLAYQRARTLPENRGRL